MLILDGPLPPNDVRISFITSGPRTRIEEEEAFQRTLGDELGLEVWRDAAWRYVGTFATGYKVNGVDGVGYNVTSVVLASILVM